MSPPSVAAPGHIVLVGMMGVGKTTVGRWLAQKLQRPFVDSDDLVEARTGSTVRELFLSSGESGFRAEESAALADALAGTAPVVVAAAGGTVLDPANRDRLRRASADGGIVVWLRADASVLAGRVVAGDHRPLLSDDPFATLTALGEAREPLYREVADVTIDEAGADGPLSPAEVSALVLAAVAPGVVHALRTRRQAQADDQADDQADGGADDSQAGS